MPYWVKRVVLKTRKFITERKLRRDENMFDGPAPVVGDKLTIACRGGKLKVRVVWGNWPGRTRPGISIIVPLRVEEI